jgi:hypothetical protein
MSFEFPASVERDIERYAQAEAISPAEAAVRLVKDALKATRRKTKDVVVTDDQIARLKALDGSFGLLEDASEEQIERMSATIQRMKREGFPARA